MNRNVIENVLLLAAVDFFIAFPTIFVAVVVCYFGGTSADFTEVSAIRYAIAWTCMYALVMIAVRERVYERLTLLNRIDTL